MFPDEKIVSWQPSVQIALLAAPIPELADIEGGDALMMAILLHLLCTSRNPDSDETIMSVSEMDRRTDMGPARIRMYLDLLTRAGVITRRRSGSYDSTYAYTVYPAILMEPVS